MLKIGSLEAMRQIRHIFLSLLLLFAASFSFAQKASFNGKVDKKQVSTSDYVVLQITASGGEIKNYTPPAFANFNVVQNYRNSGSNISIINGQMTASTTYTWVYYLQPTKTGELSIESASAEIDGQSMSTSSISITATQGAASNNQPGNNSGGNNSGNNVQTPTPSNTGNQEVFIKVYADRTKVYVGEQVNVTYKLYTRVPIYEYGVTSDATFNGFLKDEININQPKTQRETINGQQYNTAIIKQTMLFAQLSGSYESSPLEVDMVVEVRKPWGMFGYYSDYEQRSLKSNTLALEVLPLPSQGKPANFSGAVGQYEFEVEMPEEEVLKTDEEFTLRTTIKGSGNIHMIDPPKIELPQDFEVYDPQIVDNVNRSMAGFSGSKTFEYLVVPRQPGTYEIPPLKFSYFDPELETYQTISSQAHELRVEGEATVATSTRGSSGNANMEAIDSDIRFIKTDVALHEEQNRFFGTGLSMGLFFSPLLAFIGLLFVRRRQRTSVKDVVQLRRQKASRQARRRLATARKLLKKQDAKGFYDELSRAMQGYVSDKINLPMSQLNRETALDGLIRRGAEESLAAQYGELLDHCEMALFGAGGGEKDMESSYAEAAALIDALEKSIRG